MRLSYDIHLEQQQKLMITPELRQAIAVLQMSALELGEYLDNELQDNPFLETSEEPGVTETDKREEETLVTETGEDMAEWIDYFLDRSDLGFTGQASDEEERSFENLVTSSPTLQEHLRVQLHLAVDNPGDLRIGEYLIGCIDERGYLCVTVEEAASSLQVSPEAVARVLGVIQGFEPSGVGARNLQETLLIQLEQQGKATPLLRRLILEHLDAVGEGRIKQVARELGVSVLEVQDMCDILRTLNPRPGSQFDSENEVRYIIPDIIVEKINGEYIITINESATPNLRINRLYQEMLKYPQQFNPETKKYLDDKLSAALWLLKSIEHRRLTLYRVVTCIVDLQRDFLDHGIKYLRPLTLKQVADRVQVHESTISRATSNKYVQTPQGVFELKFFFSAGLKNRDCQGLVSARSIKCMVKELIEKENREEPLSDQQICELLAEKGVTCSRRTVAKYRGELGIPPASVRRRY